MTGSEGGAARKKLRCILLVNVTINIIVVNIIIIIIIVNITIVIVIILRGPSLLAGWEDDQLAMYVRRLQSLARGGGLQGR